MKTSYSSPREFCGLFVVKMPEAMYRAKLQIFLVFIINERTLPTISALLHLLMALCSSVTVNFPYKHIYFDDRIYTP